MPICQRDTTPRIRQALPDLSSAPGGPVGKVTPCPSFLTSQTAMSLAAPSTPPVILLCPCPGAGGRTAVGGLPHTCSLSSGPWDEVLVGLEGPPVFSTRPQTLGTKSCHSLSQPHPEARHSAWCSTGPIDALTRSYHSPGGSRHGAFSVLEKERIPASVLKVGCAGRALDSLKPTKPLPTHFSWESPPSQTPAVHVG